MKWYSVWIAGRSVCCVRSSSKFFALLNAIRLTDISLKSLDDRSFDVYRIH